MAYRIAKSLEVLRDQLNARWPTRDKSSDGWIGDAAHQSRESDHNPNSDGVVTALDVTHDPASGCDAGRIAEAIKGDPRVKYLIFNRRILIPPQGWKAYSGSNPHTSHLHVSVEAGKADDASPWNIDMTTPFADFKTVRDGYRNLWSKMHVTRPVDAESVATAIYQDKAAYQAAVRGTKVPWFWVACIHQRESSRDFGGILHNGERIIGTGQKTTKAPAGRGPFESWNDAAADAIKYMELDKIGEWGLARCLYEFERYNGFGYTKRGINSPYVWAGTSLQQRGKYVADNVFDAKHWDEQLGCATVLKSLIANDPEIEKELGESTEPIPGSESADDPGEPQPLSAYTTQQLMSELMSRPGITTTIHHQGD